MNGKILMYGGFAVVLLGLAILGLQVVFYLMEGWWNPFSLITVGEILTDRGWFHYPRSWKGVHKILEMIPASLTFIVVGYGLVIMGASRSTDRKSAEPAAWRTDVRQD